MFLWVKLRVEYVFFSTYDFEKKTSMTLMILFALKYAYMLWVVRFFAELIRDNEIASLETEMT